MGSMNQGNWGHLLQALPAGAEEEQALQAKDYENQQARNATDKSNMSAQDAREQFNAATQKTNAAGGLDTGTPGQGLMQQGYQQTGQVFDPARRMVLSGLQHIGDAFKSVFQGRGQQGQTNPAAAPSGRGPAPAAQANGNVGLQAPGNQPMSRPQPTSSNGSSGQIGTSGPMPLPEQPQTQGSSFAEGGAIPGRKLAGIRPKKAKPGNMAKPTAGDEQVGQTMAPRNTEPGAGISNQDPQLADGGKPKKWVGKAIKHPGALHEDLGVPQGEKIPKAKIKAAEHSKNPKTAKRAQLAETMSKWKDGGMPSLPKIQPGAAPEPKPAPNAVEQDVNNNGMRHYLGKTIKRFADGDQVRADDPPNAQGSGKVAGGASGDVPTPAGAIPERGSEGILQPIGRAIGGAANWVANEGREYANEVGGELRHTLLGDKPGPASGGATASWGSPGKGASPPQQNASPQGNLNPIEMPAHTRYDPETGKPGWAPEGHEHDPLYATPITEQQNGNLIANQTNDAYNGTQGDPNAELNRHIPGAGQQGPSMPAGRGAVPQGQAPGSVAAPGAGPQDFAPSNPDVAHLQVDQSQVPTFTTEHWQQMRNGIEHHAVANGMSGGEADVLANDTVTKFQHQNFLEYMQRAAAADAAGNKQGAMAFLKAGYQFFPTGHDMHFGLDPNSGDIIGYGVNEKTGQPVQNGAVRMNQQGMHAVMTHFADPNKFVDEGLRMQQMANETEQLHKATIPLAQARTKFFEQRDPTALAIADRRAQAVENRAKFADPHTEKFYQAEFKDLPQGGEALAAAAQLERLYEQRFHVAPDDAARAQIAGEVKSKYDPMTSPEDRAQWQKQRGIQTSQGPAPSPVPNRGDDYARTMAALSGP